MRLNMKKRTDLTVEVEDYKLNIRVGGIIKHKDCILFHKCKDKPYYALLGGRVEIGENSEEAIKREYYEETGREVEIVKYLATIENFFVEDNQKYHEIDFVYQLEFKDDKESIENIENKEGQEDLKYVWIPEKEIENTLILPMTIKEVLKENTYPLHKINNEI